jgi:hypothetical protein
MTGSSFTADSGDVTAGSKAIHDLGDATQRLGSSARAALADTSWTGNDSYGKQLRAKYVKTRDSVLDTIDAVAKGITAIGNGTLDNLDTILDTQGSVIESIDQQSGGGRS